MRKKDLTLEILSITDDPMELYQISNESELQYHIQDIERVIRTSREYRGWIFWNKSKNKQSKDVFTEFDTYEYNLTLEIHHVIFLYDIVYTTGLKMLSELKDNEFYSTFQIADRVIRDHMEGIIPIVPMLKSFHELYHEGLKDFNKEDIFGNYEVWLERYKDFISEDKLKEFKDNLKID